MKSAKHQDLCARNKELRHYLDCGNINAFWELLYNEDAHLYYLCKKSDGQLSYIKYQKMLTLLTKDVFADNQVEMLAQWCKSSSKDTELNHDNFHKENIIIILNNASQLAI